MVTGYRWCAGVAICSLMPLLLLLLFFYLWVVVSLSVSFHGCISLFTFRITDAMAVPSFVRSRFYVALIPSGAYARVLVSLYCTNYDGGREIR